MKNSWIFSIIDTCFKINIEVLKGYMNAEGMKEHLQEFLTLIKIYRSFISEEENAKVGNYFDVI